MLEAENECLKNQLDKANAEYQILDHMYKQIQEDKNVVGMNGPVESQYHQNENTYPYMITEFIESDHF
jgi:hypothetical protein